jgi:hypothetical protein
LSKVKSTRISLSSYSSDVGTSLLILSREEDKLSPLGCADFLVEATRGSLITFPSGGHAPVNVVLEPCTRDITYFGTHVSQTLAIFEMACLLEGSMLQVDVYAERSALSTPGVYPLSKFSLRDRLTATLIREEAAESLVPSSELAALKQVLNTYKVPWWLHHLSSVGGDPASYWRETLGAQINAATRGKSSTSQRKKFLWWFSRSSAVGVKYEFSQHDLDPFYELDLDR